MEYKLYTTRSSSSVIDGIKMPSEGFIVLKEKELERLKKYPAFNKAVTIGQYSIVENTKKSATEEDKKKQEEEEVGEHNV